MSKPARRSRIAIDGADRIAHRAYLKTTGLNDSDLPKPYVGVMSTYGMRLSHISREIIADSIEVTMRGHAYDALVGFAHLGAVTHSGAVDWERE